MADPHRDKLLVSYRTLAVAVYGVLFNQSPFASCVGAPAYNAAMRINFLRPRHKLGAAPDRRSLYARRMPGVLPPGLGEAATWERCGMCAGSLVLMGLREHTRELRNRVSSKVVGPDQALHASDELPPTTVGRKGAEARLASTLRSSATISASSQSPALPSGGACADRAFMRVSSRRVI